MLKWKTVKPLGDAVKNKIPTQSLLTEEKTIPEGDTKPSRNVRSLRGPMLWGSPDAENF